ncbi:hypothetical protein RugamoR57_26660 [Duganella caerulea]|uniref:hypothetical protein n=1 Tax=Duganella caerulea TaxID=2885762 RepID=UPI0030E9D918
METLNIQEVAAVSGARINAFEAAELTIALMALGGPVAVGVGVAALMYYAWS